MHQSRATGTALQRGARTSLNLLEVQHGDRASYSPPARKQGRLTASEPRRTGGEREHETAHTSKQASEATHLRLSKLSLLSFRQFQLFFRWRQRFRLVSFELLCPRRQHESCGAIARVGWLPVHGLVRVAAASDRLPALRHFERPMHTLCVHFLRMSGHFAWYLQRRDVNAEREKSAQGSALRSGTHANRYSHTLVASAQHLAPLPWPLWCDRGRRLWHLPCCPCRCSLCRQRQPGQSTVL